MSDHPDRGQYPRSRPQAGTWLAVSGLVAALAGFVVLGYALGPLGIVLGVLGLRRGGRYRGLATAAVVIGAIVTLLSILGLVANAHGYVS